jgi:hypothetical protein
MALRRQAAKEVKAVSSIVCWLSMDGFRCQVSAWPQADDTDSMIDKEAIKKANIEAFFRFYK